MITSTSGLKAGLMHRAVKDKNNDVARHPGGLFWDGEFLEGNDTIKAAF